MAFEKEMGDSGIVLPFCFLHFHFFHFWLKDALYLFFILLTLLFIRSVFFFNPVFFFLFSLFASFIFWFLSCILEMSSDANPPIPSKSIFPPPFHHYYYNNILRFFWLLRRSKS